MGVLLAGLLEIGKGFITDWQQGRENKRKIAAAAAENRARLLLDTESHNAEWEMRALEGRDNVLRRLSFVAWSAPLVWAVFDPQGAANYFRVTLAALPDWYVAGYLSISGAVWGLAELKARGVVK